MTFRTVLLFYFLLFQFFCFGQPTVNWLNNVGSFDLDRGQGICMDNSNNVLVTGIFSATVDFDGGIGVDTLTSQGGTDAFVQKLDTSGNLMLAINAVSGAGNIIGEKIATDNLGNIYLLGALNGSADFDPGTSSHILASLGSTDWFIQKLDPFGNLIWAHTFGGSGYDYGYGFFVTPVGDVYIAGTFGGTVDFDPGIGVANVTSTLLGTDVFVQKIDSSGQFVWVKTVAGDNNADGQDITVDDFGNVIITGGYTGVVDFDPGTNVYNLTANDKDIFIWKLTDQGNFIWAKSIGGGAYDTGQNIDTDANGNIYIGGRFEWVVDFDPSPNIFNVGSNGSSDMFVLKLDSAGGFGWTFGQGGTNSDVGMDLVIENNQLYLTGNFYGIVDFDPDLLIFSNQGQTNQSVSFVQKLDTSGNLIWVRVSDGLGTTIGSEIVIDGLSNVYFTGYFTFTTDFDLGSGNFIITSLGSWNIYVIRYSDSQMVSVDLDQFQLPSISIYPNPTSGLLNIIVDDLHPLGTSFVLYDISGKEVFTSKIYSNQTQIDVSNYPKGVYFYKLLNDNQNYSGKLIIQ